MKFGLNLPIHGAYADPNLLIELAVEAEVAGWDGFFVWDHIAWQSGGKAVALTEPWIVLAAVAARTERIRIGPLVTPLSRRRPWKVARETVALDHLSGGRLTLGVGLGPWPKVEFQAFAEEADDRARGTMLDEALALLVKLWSGDLATVSGEHFQIKDAHFLPTPVQKPRIPIWVAGSWRNNNKRRPFRRAACFEGTFPFIPKGQATPEVYAAIHAYVAQHRTSAEPFDVILSQRLDANDIATSEKIDVFASAGVTWWLTSATSSGKGLKDLRHHIRQGPPR